ncbi:hypothetical protein K5V21_18945 [Clostridium sardiniense]|uniref:Zinc ribbon domain-containing protein n=1 Tax=Clostridium sardiniense TaxID=29369 RepID=A0ABS7L336_CLOSR|nr:hypothetical protein [Clostridium sardiniense]MBY0757479.1 hypothetical protein [Clostridium sardiniense]MDQ0462234.1 Zn finger protein HypA/HybF involved in hydrogenase expression [Clostridium sardiniense]
MRGDIIFYCLECNETFTCKELIDNEDFCPICNAPDIEVWKWNDFRIDNPTLPKNPKPGVKYDIHKDYSKEK